MRRWIGATLIGGAAVSALLVYQVPIMVAAGLTTGTAATVAGARGIAQLAGRVPLGPAVRHLGTRRTLVVTHAIAAGAALLLLGTNRLAVAIAYSLLAGASIGALYALQGIYTTELVDRRHLGMLVAVQQAVFAFGGALGPIVLGVLLQLGGSHRLLTLPASVALIVAAMILSPAARVRN
jgi:MFS family permease